MIELKKFTYTHYGKGPEEYHILEDSIRSGNMEPYRKVPEKGVCNLMQPLLHQCTLIFTDATVALLVDYVHLVELQKEVQQQEQSKVRYKRSDNFVAFLRVGVLRHKKSEFFRPSIRCAIVSNFWAGNYSSICRLNDNPISKISSSILCSGTQKIDIKNLFSHTIHI